MDESERFLAQYKYGLEVIVDMVAHMAKRGDRAALQWLILSFAQAVACAGQTLRDQDLQN